MKALVVVDLDGTLAESKSAIDAEIAMLLTDLLGVVKVAIISGGDFPQFEKQVLAHLQKSHLDNLSLLPTCGTRFFPIRRWLAQALLGRSDRSPEAADYRCAE